jgi:DNA invertase Pin-like site-specific DNA recombinase
MKVVAYARVSTNNHHQDPEVQLRDIRKYCEMKGWELTQEYVDRGVSGTKSSRPELNKLMEDAKSNQFNAVIVWRFDRFARSTQHLLSALETFRCLGISFVSTTEAVDTSTAMGTMVFTILGAVATMEREVTVERIRAGLRNAKSKGRIPGKKRQELDLHAIRERIAHGESLRKVAASLSISPALLSKRLHEEAKQAAFDKEFDAANPTRN